MKKISLFVMTEKGYEITKALVETFPLLIDKVIIGRDKNIDRDFSEEIEELCSVNSIDFYYREDNFELNQRDYVFAISWRWLIHHPEDRLIIFHDSLLPKYRGFAPLVNMLINGEDCIGVTALFGAENYDEGDIICQKSTPITYPIKIQEAINLNIKNYVELCLDIASSISEQKSLVATPQDNALASISPWRDANDYFIDWSMDANIIKRFVDALGAPYDGAKTMVDGKTVIIEDVEVQNNNNFVLNHVGKLIAISNGMPEVICGKGSIRVVAARYEESGDSLLPLNKFRLRFG